MNKFQEKEIYTIQQFQYRQIPNYKWSVKYFKKMGIDEWDSFCENCLMEYSKQSKEVWDKLKNLNS